DTPCYILTITIHLTLLFVTCIHLYSFFFNDPATPYLYTLSLHDALPISLHARGHACRPGGRSTHADRCGGGELRHAGRPDRAHRSEEHTSELQSLAYLVCRLLLEKKKKTATQHYMESVENQCSTLNARTQ